MPKVLVLGATGATGSLLVEQFLSCSFEVIVIVRSIKRLPEKLRDQIEVLEADISEVSEKDLGDILADCDGVVSCLGHNLSFKGVFGQPRSLVANAVDKVCQVAESMARPLKIVLMSSSGVQNDLIDESVPLSQKAVIAILRYVIPPHKDNEQAAAVLVSATIPKTSNIEWVIVRPDTLIDETKISAYELKVSPTRNVIFNAGQTSRINVANFIACLLSESELWQSWKGKMPVIYNTINNSEAN